MIADKIGSKKILMIACADITIWSIALAVQKNIVLLIVFRTLKGLGMGVITSIAPMYIAELAPTKRRGALGSIYQFFVTVGITLDYVLNLAFHNVKDGWR